MHFLVKIGKGIDISQFVYIGIATLVVLVIILLWFLWNSFRRHLMHRHYCMPIDNLEQLEQISRFSCPSTRVDKTRNVPHQNTQNTTQPASNTKQFNKSVQSGKKLHRIPGEVFFTVLFGQFYFWKFYLWNCWWKCSGHTWSVLKKRNKFETIWLANNLDMEEWSV